MVEDRDKERQHNPSLCAHTLTSYKHSGGEIIVSNAHITKGRERGKGKEEREGRGGGGGGDSRGGNREGEEH